MSMRLTYGSPLAIITKVAIIECFNIKKHDLTRVDLQKSEEEYIRLRRTHKKDELPIYMKRGVNNKVMPISSSITKPFDVQDFQIYFKKT
jgi:hypothetical protein